MNPYSFNATLCFLILFGLGQIPTLAASSETSPSPSDMEEEESPAPEARAQGLIDAFDGMIIGPTQRGTNSKWYSSVKALLTEYGESTSPTSSHSNPSSTPISSRVLTRLKTQFAQLTNYQRVQDIFDKCLVDDGPGRNLRQIILDSTGLAAITSDACQKALSQIEKTTDDVDKIITASQTHDFLKDAVGVAQENTLKAFADFHLRHKKGFAPLSLAREFCKGGLSGPYCRDLTSKRRSLEDYASIWKDYARFRPSNTLANEFNKFLKETDYLQEEGSIAFLMEDKMLFLTPHLREIIKNRGIIRYNDIETARAQMYEGIRREQAILAKMDKTSDPKKQRDELKLLVKTNPIAIGSVLINRPESASLVCHLIQEISHEDFASQERNEKFVYGTLIAGGALMATGLLSWAGAAIAGTGTLVASVATAATVVSMGAGTAVGVAAGARNLTLSMERRAEAHQLEAGIFSTNADQYSETALARAVDQYHSLEMQALTELGLSAVALAPLKLLAKSGALKEAIETLTRLTNDKSKTIMNKALSLLNKEEVRRFLDSLRTMPKEQYEKFAAKLQGLSAKAAADLIRETASKGADLTKSIAKKGVRGTKNYGRALKATKYKRLLVKKRIRSGGPLYRALDALDNPLAAATNSRRQATIPVTLMGWSLAYMAYDITADAIKEEVTDESEEAHKLTANVTNTGTEYIGELAINGAIDADIAVETAQSHQKNLQQWIHNAKPLPRVQEWRTANYLSEVQYKELNKLAKQVFARVTNVPGLDKGKQEELLSTSLLEEIESSRVFSRVPSSEKRLFANFFVPVVKIGETTDNRLYLEMLQSQAKGRTLIHIRPEVAHQIQWSMEHDNLAFSEVTRMLAEASLRPDSIKAKQARAKQVLPPEKRYLGNRPDLPEYATPHKHLDGSGREMVFKNELDYYQAIMAKPRFKEFKDQWLNGELNDRQVLDYSQKYATYFDQIMALRKAGGFGGGRYKALFNANDELENPLFLQVFPLIDGIDLLPREEGVPELTSQEFDNCVAAIFQISSDQIVEASQLSDQLDHSKMTANSDKALKDLTKIDKQISAKYIPQFIQVADRCRVNIANP